VPLCGAGEHKSRGQRRCKMRRGMHCCSAGGKAAGSAGMVAGGGGEVVKPHRAWRRGVVASPPASHRGKRRGAAAGLLPSRGGRLGC
jgi:hypothetical protein